MVVLEATVDQSQVERELEQIDDPQVDVEGEMTPTGGQAQEQTQLLGGIGRKLTMILGAVGALLQLDTVIELLDGMFRILEIALLPLIAIINALLRPVLESLLQWISSINFDMVTNAIEEVMNNVVDNIGRDIQRALGLTQSQSGDPTGYFGGEAEIERLSEANQSRGGGGSDQPPQTMWEQLGSEFSPEALREKWAEFTSENTDNDGPGGTL